MSLPHDTSESTGITDADGRYAYPPCWMSYPTASYWYGMSRTTLWRMVKAGELEAVNVGRGVRISRASLNAYYARAKGGA